MTGGCLICSSPFTQREAKHNARICTNCAARSMTKTKGWGMPTPVNAADKARQGKELAAQLQQRIEADELWLEDAQEWDRKRRQMRVAGSEALEFTTTNEGEG